MGYKVSERIYVKGMNMTAIEQSFDDFQYLMKQKQINFLDKAVNDWICTYITIFCY